MSSRRFSLFCSQLLHPPMAPKRPGTASAPAPATAAAKPAGIGRTAGSAPATEAASSVPEISVLAPVSAESTVKSHTVVDVRSPGGAVPPTNVKAAETPTLPSEPVAPAIAGDSVCDQGATDAVDASMLGEPDGLTKPEASVSFADPRSGGASAILGLSGSLASATAEPKPRCATIEVELPLIRRAASYRTKRRLYSILF